ncbi:hypothetical protein M9H77_23342 [Catharanthus roseus]|uniref:Uncharacterized protein n=1 Tax=Catharanthus roseus TaxID=4058 RepID=A0ACC0AV81_CATRO|nr:hypothetical protein M9H77_23342 [Catharanthus roseus]
MNSQIMREFLCVIVKKTLTKLTKWREKEKLLRFLFSLDTTIFGAIRSSSLGSKLPRLVVRKNKITNTQRGGGHAGRGRSGTGNQCGCRERNHSHREIIAHYAWASAGDFHLAASVIGIIAETPNITSVTAATVISSLSVDEWKWLVALVISHANTTSSERLSCNFVQIHWITDSGTTHHVI